MTSQKKYDEAEEVFLKSIELGNDDTGITSLIALYDGKYDNKYSLFERVFDHNVWEKSEDLIIKKME